MRRFLEEAGRGIFAMQRCEDCGRWNHPPLPRCRDCHGTALSWTPVSGRGAVRSYTTASPRLMKLGPEPMVFVRVELHVQDGLLHVARLVRGGDTQARRGLEVDVCFEPGPDGALLPQFRPM